MEIEPIDKKIIGEIDLNYFVKVSTKNQVTPTNINKKLSKLLNGIEYQYSIISMKYDKYESQYQYYLLIKINNESNLIDNLYKNVNGKGSINLLKNRILLKVEKTSVTKGRKVTGCVEEFREVTGTDFIGKNIEIRVVPIINKEMSKYYISRYATENTSIKTWLFTPQTLR